jgi:hypothetical protein
VRRPPPTLLLLAALGAAACARPKVQITPEFDLRTDAGTPLECSAFADLGCVNFIKFQIAEQGDLTPPLQCITVDKRLNTLCDLDQLAKGTEIFRYDRDARVQLKLWGLRVFPATSCEIVPDCPPKTLFAGKTEFVTVGELQDGKLPLTITDAKACGRREVYHPRGNRDCYSVCEYSEPVCELQEGCVCLVQDDAGVRSLGGAWENLDAGVD